MQDTTPECNKCHRHLAAYKTDELMDLTERTYGGLHNCGWACVLKLGLCGTRLPELFKPSGLDEAAERNDGVCAPDSPLHA